MRRSERSRHEDLRADLEQVGIRKAGPRCAAASFQGESPALSVTIVSLTGWPVTRRCPAVDAGQEGEERAARGRTLGVEEQIGA